LILFSLYFFFFLFMFLFSFYFLPDATDWQLRSL